MTEANASYRRIVRSSSILGGAWFINIAIGLLRTKVLAVLLGPLGVGLTSLYIGLVTTAASFATLGVGTVGTRQIAEASSRNDVHVLAVARRAMFWGTLILAIAGALVVWSLRVFLAEQVLGSASRSGIVAWLSLGVALSVAAAAQGALIQGMRRVGDLARVNVFSAVLNTALGIALIWRWGNAGLVGYVLLGPASSFVLGHFYVSKLPKIAHDAVTNHEVIEAWKALLRLGLAFVAAEAVGTLVQLAIRVYVGRTLGTESLGHYQAAWTISTQYISFVLMAMAADYYPRLSGLNHDAAAASRLVNEQTEIATLLSAPVFIAMMALAPWVLRLLYTASFAPAVEVLRWQVLADVLKVASWPLGFVILAAGDGKTFFWSESASWFVTGAFVMLFMPLIGFRATGIASLVCYGFYLPVVYWLARRRIGFRWTGSVFGSIVITFAICAGVGILAVLTKWGMWLGSLVAIADGIFAVGRISHMSDLGGTLGRIGALARRITGVHAA
jgi:O-antigen/teichoic acid export membrane protein